MRNRVIFVSTKLGHMPVVKEEEQVNHTIVFIHGAWVTPLCWENFMAFFDQKGFHCLAPAWPYRDRPIEELRRTPPPELATLGVTEIVDHFANVIKRMDKPPILIGHSFGGLFVQMLLDRGAGSAGVAIDSAPPKGVLPRQWSAIKSNVGVISTPGGWRKVLRMSLKEFQYAFVNTLSESEQKAVYEKYVVPETGRIFFQAALAVFNNATYVNFKNDRRAPLLLIAGSQDNVVPATQNRSNFKKYQRSSSKTDFKEFSGRSHWIIAQEGWQEVAGYIENWLSQLPAL